jgi:ketosteroid isomerase-like protein
MSQRNIDLVREVYARVTADLRIPHGLLDPDWSLDATDVSPDVAGILRGPAATEELRPYWETFDDFRVEIEEVIHADDRQVVDVVRDGGQIKGSDAEVWNRFFHVWTFGDGKIVHLSIHSDRKRALEAAGLSE